MQNTKSSGENAGNRKVRIFEVKIAHTSWYWCYRPGQPTKLRFFLEDGKLMLEWVKSFQLKKKICVGLDLSSRPATEWLHNASLQDRQRIRTAKLPNPQYLDYLTMVPELNVLECSDLSNRHLQFIVDQGLPLRMLYIDWGGKLSDLSALKRLTTLLRLHIADCSQLFDLTGIEDQQGLTRLDIVGCNNLGVLDPIAALKQLRHLVICNCNSVTRVNPVGVLHELVHLDLSRCEYISDISPLVELKALRKLDLSDCTRLTDISPLTELPQLRDLNLFGCRHLEDLRPLNRLQNLRRISLPSTVSNEELTMICISFNTLIHLDLRNCGKITDITPVGDLKKLKTLKLSGTSVTDLSPLSKLPHLQRLEITNCHNVNDLAPLEDIPHLEDIFLGGCKNLTEDEIERFKEVKPKCHIHKM